MFGYFTTCMKGLVLEAKFCDDPTLKTLNSLLADRLVYVSIVIIKVHMMY